jgi:hypothetical protein
MYASINYAGSWHDSHVASDLMTNYMTSSPYALIADKAFKGSGDMHDKIFKPIKKKAFANMNGPEKSVLKKLSSAIVSLRQTVEWGMRAIQATFGRLKCRLSSDKQKRVDLILVILLIILELLTWASIKSKLYLKKNMKREFE